MSTVSKSASQDETTLASSPSKSVKSASPSSTHSDHNTMNEIVQGVGKLIDFSTYGASVTETAEQRNRIKKVYHMILKGVEMHFNYCCLLIIASVVAVMGLATDSATTVISSMLISPIMGPVVGMS